MPNHPRSKQISKLMSSILRYNAPKYNICIYDGGFVNVADMLNLPQFIRLRATVDDIMEEVDTNDKQRFALRYLDDVLQIRANQGHTFYVPSEELFVKLDRNTIPAVVVHGTTRAALKLIMQTGLSRMKRTHIHFCPGLPGCGQIISGFKANSTVGIIINTDAAMRDGIPFYMSSNNVVLSPGNANGIIEPKYFKEIVSLQKQ